MTNGIDQGGYFHPCETSAGIVTGITRRDWLAGLAMQGLVSKEGILGQTGNPVTVKSAYQIADLMIAESRNEE